MLDYTIREKHPTLLRISQAIKQSLNDSLNSSTLVEHYKFKFLRIETCDKRFVHGYDFGEICFSYSIFTPFIPRL